MTRMPVNPRTTGKQSAFVAFAETDCAWIRALCRLATPADNENLEKNWHSPTFHTAVRSNSSAEA
jgi:hypothetical protein